MKILICHTYNKGYLSRFFHELAVKLSGDGHNLVSFSWKRAANEEYRDGIKVIIKKKKGYFKNYAAICTIIKREQPDVIISNFSYVNPALLFGKLLGVKNNIAWFHSLNEQMLPTKKQVFIKTKFLMLADTIVANSFITKKQLERSYKVPAHKVKVIPFWSNISNQEKVQSTIVEVEHENSIKIGCPGRMATHKNQKIVIEALHSLQNTSQTQYHLYFAGDGEEQVNLKKQVKQLGLIDQVSFLGHLSAADMYSFYKSMDVIVLPSLDEAFGLVFIEAITLGVPVLVSSKFGALTFIDETQFKIADFTFDAESFQDLANKLKSFEMHSNLNSSFFKTLYDITFDKERIYEHLKTLITEIS